MWKMGRKIKNKTFIPDEILVCPKCKGKLEYNKRGRKLFCHECKITYPIKEDIPIMLISQTKEIQYQIKEAGFDDPTNKEELFYIKAREWLPAKIEGNMLDLGCNRGYEIDFWHKRYPDIRGYGIDVYYEALRTGKDIYNFIPILADMHNLPFLNNFFDFIYAKEILEHSYNPYQLLGELYRVLKKQGIFFGWLPLITHTDTMHLWKIANKNELMEVLVDFGFEIVKYDKFEYTPLLPDIKYLAQPYGVRFLVKKY